MENYIYCVREQALCENAPVYFKIGHANDLERRKSCMQTANPRPLRTVFVLGPFLDRGEAEDVESQAHSLLAAYRVRGEWFSVNPLTLPEFWGWIDAQLLPICVHEKSALRAQPVGSARRLRRWATKRHRHGHTCCSKRYLQGTLDLG